MAGSCDKITKTSYLTLPGGLALPLGLETVTLLGYDLTPEDLDEAQAEAQMQSQLERSVQQGMIAGTILDEKTDLTRHDGIYELTASVRCEEMIARTVRVSILKEETIP